MQVMFHLTKGECFSLIREYYQEQYGTYVEMTPVLSFSTERKNLSSKINSLSLNPNDLLHFLSYRFQQAGFLPVQSIIHTDMENNESFQGVSMVLQVIGDIQLNALPEWLKYRFEGLQTADRIRTFQIRK